jgi:hypothetical protein
MEMSGQIYSPAGLFPEFQNFSWIRGIVGPEVVWSLRRCQESNPGPVTSLTALSQLLSKLQVVVLPEILCEEWNWKALVQLGSSYVTGGPPKAMQKFSNIKIKLQQTVGHCIFSELRFIYKVFRKSTILPSSGGWLSFYWQWRWLRSNLGPSDWASSEKVTLFGPNSRHSSQKLKKKVPIT